MTTPPAPPDNFFVGTPSGNYRPPTLEEYAAMLRNTNGNGKNKLTVSSWVALVSVSLAIVGGGFGLAGKLFCTKEEADEIKATAALAASAQATHEKVQDKFESRIENWMSEIDKKLDRIARRNDR